MFQTELSITLKNHLLVCCFITFSNKHPQLPITGTSCEKIRGYPYYLEKKKSECRSKKTCIVLCSATYSWNGEL